MDRITAAKVLLETVGRGSISAAASHLGMSRAMATRYISSMEDWAEARLLHRTTRKLSLTAAGEEAVSLCRELVALSENISTVGTQDGNNPKGLLRVTASSAFCQFYLADALAKFLQIHPAVSIDLQAVDRTMNLAEDGIDLAIRATNDLDPNVIARKVGEVRSTICASPAYLKEHGRPNDVRDLVAHNCITYAYYGRSIWDFNIEGENITVPVTGSFTTNEASIVLRATLNGTGIAMLPDFAIQDSIKKSELINIFPDCQIKPLGLYAVYLSRSRVPSALRALIDFLSQDLLEK